MGFNFTVNGIHNASFHCEAGQAWAEEEAERRTRAARIRADDIALCRYRNWGCEAFVIANPKFLAMAKPGHEVGLSSKPQTIVGNASIFSDLEGTSCDLEGFEMFEMQLSSVRHRALRQQELLAKRLLLPSCPAGSRQCTPLTHSQLASYRWGLLAIAPCAQDASVGLILGPSVPASSRVMHSSATLTWT